MESKINMSRLLDELDHLKFSDQLDSSGVLMAFKPSGGVPVLHPMLRAAVEEIETITGRKAMHVMVNRVPAGVVVPVHTDTIIGNPERWHLPVKTNRLAMFWDEVNGECHLHAGRWHGPILYHKQHQIYNYGCEERVHVIVDVEPMTLSKAVELARGGPAPVPRQGFA